MLLFFKQEMASGVTAALICGRGIRSILFPTVIVTMEKRQEKRVNLQKSAWRRHITYSDDTIREQVRGPKKHKALKIKEGPS